MIGMYNDILNMILSAIQEGKNFAKDIKKYKCFHENIENSRKLGSPN
jgi:hypothetical protein